MNQATFIEVILPLALPKEYTYAISFEEVENIRIGQQVIVQFGRKRFYTAIVSKIHHQKPAAYQPKLIETIVDLAPIVTQKQLELWRWISQYYMCTVGEVMAVALPSSLKLSSESIFSYLENKILDWDTLSADEYLVAEALELNGELKTEDVQAILGKKTVYPVLQKLMYHRICVVQETIQQKYTPKKVSFVQLNPRFANENALQEIFQKLEKRTKQVAVLLTYLQMAPHHQKIEKSKLTKSEKVSSSSLTTLIKNEVFVESKETISRLLQSDIEIKHLESLSEAQSVALQSIKDSYVEKNVAVLEGVTGSGKTHIYIKLIEDAIAQKQQVLYLLPEIALTAQIVLRLSKYFGNKVGIYHSKFNDNERVEIYQKVLKKEYQIVLAARSGVFLPFQDLGLIIVDEEHERSYKQFEPSPRYHARDTAVMMSHLYGAKVLLGSATLSLETRRNIDLGKYAHVLLSERFGDAVLPKITLLNTIDLRNRKKMTGIFSDVFKEKIKEVLAKNEQVILFQNRRGFANFLQCHTCAWIPQCKSCDVSLTYHKYFNHLVCHYCGYKEKMPSNCKACGSQDTSVKGIGTEQIEEEVNILFPNAKTARLDLETTRTKHGHEAIIFAFQREEVDILIGTQMVTKGLDFGNVTLVGIINSDQLIHFPDFRASERAFQLIAQVSGRAGRQKTKGEVLIQSSDPQAPVLQQVQQYNFEEFYFNELHTRSQFHYPPFVSLIQITIKHKLAEAVRDASNLLGRELRNRLHNRVLGPTTPPVSRIRNQYLKQIMIKLDKNHQQIIATKKLINEAISMTKTEFKSVRFVIDVDP